MAAMPTRVNLLVVLSIVVSGCASGPVGNAGQSSTPVPHVTILPTHASSATPRATRQPNKSARPSALATRTPRPTVDSTGNPTETTSTGGAPSATCVNGWTAPIPGSDAFEAGVAILGGRMGVSGTWDVSEMRYFTGPAGQSTEPGAPVVERWYVKARLDEDPQFRARWLLLRSSPIDTGIAAVAAWDTTAYQSPDWTGFIGDGEPTAYLGLPGLWSGLPYDFVSGNGGPGEPGLPDALSGCLDGT